MAQVVYRIHQLNDEEQERCGRGMAVWLVSNSVQPKTKITPDEILHVPQ
jgi:hypothetical protein